MFGRRRLMQNTVAPDEKTVSVRAMTVNSEANGALVM